MGCKNRKNINLGLSFRINLSKKDIRYSQRVPGYRITKMENDENKSTYSLPEASISYLKRIGRSLKNKDNSDKVFEEEKKCVKNIQIEELNKNDLILKELSKYAFLNNLSNLLLFSILLAFYKPILILGLLVSIIIKYKISSKKIKLYYDFDDESMKKYNFLKEALKTLSNSEKLWQINATTTVNNVKYNAGAETSVSRNSVFITSKMPCYIKTNTAVYILKLKNQKIFFTPDRILILKPFCKVLGYSYDDIFLEIKTTKFVETERIYNDVEIVNYTWKYANKDGSRDLRFSGNRRFPVCKYGEFIIKTLNDTNIDIYFSNHKLSSDIQNNLVAFCNQFKKNKDVIKENEDDKKAFADEISQQIKKNTLTENYDKKEAIKSTINKNYKLPKTNILKDEDSKSIIPFIEKMKNQKNIYIPIGTSQDNILLESIESMPNMMIGGTVMSGKTTYINTIIASILLSKRPTDVKLVIYDSKMVDYAIYNGIPHLLCPVLTDSKELSAILLKICVEINLRTEMLKKENVKNIDSLNKKINNDLKIPDIIVIIDDFSTLNISYEANNSIEYITSFGWNVNVYLIVSTNYPSQRVMPIVSKSKFPARICFRVTSSQVSRVIIDDVGAEKLDEIGMALYTSRLHDLAIKIKVPYVTDEDIRKIVNHCITEQIASYENMFMNLEKEEHNEKEIFYREPVEVDREEPLYNEIVNFVIKNQKASASLLQRKFKIGYNKAATMMDELEKDGIIGSPKGDGKPRDVLVKNIK